MTDDNFLQRHYPDQWQDALVEDIPDHTWPQMEVWFVIYAPKHLVAHLTGGRKAFGIRIGWVAHLINRLHLPIDLPRITSTSASWGKHVKAADLANVLNTLRTSGRSPLVLAVVETLCVEADQPERAAEDLDRLLADGSSAWTVTPEGRLERRVTAEAREAAAVAIGRGGAASDHLARAWSAAFGLNPSAPAAYLEANQAIEVAAGPIVLPKEPPSTGKIIAALDMKPSKWSHVLVADDGAVESTIAMLRMFWQSNVRHGTLAGPARNNISEAQAAVHLAIVLVEWFRSGAIKRSDEEN
ncbi:MAG: hypothetical protein AAGA90_07770 [Actinomycetota bacterium]